MPWVALHQLSSSPKWGVREGPCLLGTDSSCCPRFADQYGARAALSLSFVAASALYLLLAASCSPALPGVFLLFASRLPSALMHTLTGRDWWVDPAERGERGEMRAWLQVGGRWRVSGMEMVHGLRQARQSGEVCRGVDWVKGAVEGLWVGGIQSGWRGCEAWPSWRSLRAWPGHLSGLSSVRGRVQLSSLLPAAAQMVITDLTVPAERPAALGRLGLCFGVGMILGSLLGGTLSTTYG